MVFGCGGDRDKTKRPRMAAVAKRWADVIIVTSDNPRCEKPEAIIDDIMAGFKGNHSCVECIVSRRDAITAAIGRANTDDVILIAGKGHEDYQVIGDDDVSRAGFR